MNTAVSSNSNPPADAPARTVGDVMTPDPITVRMDAPLQMAARLLEENEISGMPVVDAAGALVGVLSETDLVRARATQHLWSRWPGLAVRHLMHAPVLTADREMGLREAAVLMEKAHVHRLIVVGEDQQTPIGVISTSDLVRAIVGEHADD
ncbi:MAG TPA: CBS domain-containing protein [Thermoleophilia bacterium]|nr:CBS domain-containing protein [Thermoleophilia bacterium]